MNIFGQLIAAQLTFQVLINILLQLVQNSLDSSHSCALSERMSLPEQGFHLLN